MPSTVTVWPLSGVVAPVPCTSAIVWVTSAANAGVAAREESPRAAIAAVAMAASRRPAGGREVGDGVFMTRIAPLFEVDSVVGCPPFGGQVMPTPARRHRARVRASASCVVHPPLICAGWDQAGAWRGSRFDGVGGTCDAVLRCRADE